jgi:hypothetical protein
MPRVVISPAAARARLARQVVDVLGGRFSAELGIDLDAASPEVDRWFLASTLFGARIPASVAQRAYRVLAAAGVHTIADADRRSWEELVALLDAGGYARYDYRTATRLHALADALAQQHEGDIATLVTITDARELEAALDALPGWGPTTVGIFLRELRGIWRGADPPIDERALEAARHLRLLGEGSTRVVRQLTELARSAHLDVRDLEAGLVRLALRHRPGTRDCPGGEACVALLHQSPKERSEG